MTNNKKQTKKERPASSGRHRTKKTTKKEETNPVTDEITAVLEEIVEETSAPEKKKGETVVSLDESNFMIGERQYRLVADHREGFDADKLGERYSEVLGRYDYIVGDWGYEQLRLKGFFREDNRRAHPEQRIDALQDYLYEYCNFGCAYFVIERIGGKKETSGTRRRRRKTSDQAFIEEKKGPVKPKNKRPVIKNREERKETADTRSVPSASADKKTEQKNSFTIRQREE